MSRPGLATDEQLAGVGGRVVAVRIVLAAAGGSCACAGPAHDGPALVALDPGDAAVPAAERGAVSRVAPGLAVADTAWAFLAGGTVALVGLDVVVHQVMSLGATGDGPGPVLFTLSDLAVSLGRVDPAHVPPMRTVVVVRGPGAVPEGWEAEPVEGLAVPVATGIRASHPTVAVA